jgi:hypothetical protein
MAPKAEDKKKKSGRYKPGTRKGKGGIHKMQLQIKTLQAQVDLLTQQRGDALKQVEKLESQNKQLNQHAEQLAKIPPIPDGWGL